MVGFGWYSIIVDDIMGSEEVVRPDMKTVKRRRSLSDQVDFRVP
jgi:hypothetical protein